MTIDDLTTHADLVHAAQRIRSAVRDPGGHPDYHRRILTRHRGEWPLLWHWLDALLDATDRLDT